MSDARILELVERAFDYRGYVTVARRDGTKLVGFVYHRDRTHVEMLDERGAQHIRLAIDDVTDVVFTGEDCAAKAQRSWERRRGTLEPRETSAGHEWLERPTLILVALPIELGVVARVLGAKIRNNAAHGWLGDAHAIALCVGVGGGAARAIAAEQPGLVMSCGFAGALESSLAPGDLVIASSVCDESGETFAAPDSATGVARLALGHQMRIAHGEFVCTTRIAATREDKRALARPGRVAVDLESWAVARAAQRANIPWLALRVVVDPFEVDLPAFAREVAPRYAASALRYALGGPRAAVDVVQLGFRARTARRSLERALRRLAPALGHLSPPRSAS